MSERFSAIQELLDRVRRRWRRLVLLDVTTRASVSAAAVIAAAFVLARWILAAPVALVVVAIVALIGVGAAIGWAIWPARHAPSNRRVARFIEEREPALDERLVSAVDVATSRDAAERPALAEAMVADAARAAAAVDPAAIVPGDAIRRRAWRAVAAVALLALAIVVARHTMRQAVDAVALLLFPSHVTLEVTPGNARVQAGSGLTVQARLVGNTAPVVAQLLRAPNGSDDWQPAEMQSAGDGRFVLDLGSLTTSFRYKVLAGAVASPAFDVSVLKAPRVARIDVEYEYPRTLGLQPRVEEDGGDIYGPEGTNVTVKVHTDGPVTTGQMLLGAEKSLGLSVESPTVLRGSLQITENGSYRVALADADGMKSQGDTEYFIRILDDRPPEVHVVRPASDRRVTRLEEVEIAAEAQDDFGVSALELVYAVRGGAEKVVPLGIPLRSTSVTGHYVMYLEDLDVSAGDFVSYYVRARDLPRGKRASESRSDIFFLEVKPFEEEFTLAQTQAAMGGGSGNPQLDDLVAAQKEIVVATWKLDRRSRDAQGAKSETDIRAVAKSEAELKLRVEQTASGFRESTMRDPRRTRPARPGAGPQPPTPVPPAPAAPRVGQSTPEEDAMTTASNAMGRAVAQLESLKTTDALPHEMAALNALLKAQADVKKRQIQRQQGGSGAGSNRSTEDLSSLFDKELARNQQTNYENKTSAEQTDDRNASPVDRIKELAERQDELVRRQQAFARNRAQMSAEEVRRQLENLTRDQNELRDRAEQVAQQLQQQGQQGQQQQASQDGQPGQQGSKGQSGQSSGQAGQSAGQQGQSGQSGQRRPGDSQNARAGQQGAEGNAGSQQMRAVSEEMRNAASGLRRQDAGQASASAARALEQLRNLERQMQGSTAEGQRRALGDLQLEARQLADAQRQIAGESGRAGDGQASGDALRRLAGEQDRLAERLERVQQGLRQSAATPSGAGRQPSGGQGQTGASLQQAATEAAREIEQQRLAARMQQSADAMRTAAGQTGPASEGQSPGGTPTARPGASSQAGAQQELARALDRLADRLNLADTPQDGDSRRMTEQVARARDLRSRIDDLTRQLQELDRQASSAPQGSAQPGGQAPGRASQSNQQGEASGGSTGASDSAAGVREEIQKQMREVRELLSETQREATAHSNGGRGSTFEGQGMVLSAPGTEGFKQDFSKWQELARQVTLALDDVESSLSKKLQEKTSSERLASGADERVPAGYQQQVDSYFKALASRKRP